MKAGSGYGEVLVAIGLILILMLSVGGVAVFFAVSRQQVALAMEVERAQVAETQARIRAEASRAQAEVIVPKRPAPSREDSSNGESNSIRAAIESVLRAQEHAWNAGDVDAFMEHYWKSEKMTFNSGGKTTRGWTETLKRYRERYPTRDKMGHLELSELEITPLGNSAALVLGQWKLERESDRVSGNFTLVLRKFDKRWLIIHDHTSQKTN